MNEPTIEQIARIINPPLWKRYDADARAIAVGYEVLGLGVDNNHPDIINTLEIATKIKKMFKG